MTRSSNITQRKRLRELLWFNRIFIAVAFVGTLIGIYFTTGTPWVTLPVTIGALMIIVLLINNACIADIRREVA
jgi:hypothetical protein